MAAPLSQNLPAPWLRSQAAKVKILMVDDEEKNLLALEAVLDGLGQELVKAHSGKEALRSLMHEDFALILLDVQMPEMDGFETATLIRSRARSRYTPIIFLTAVGKTESEMFRGYEVGAVDYILKPFAPEILRYKVGVLVELHRMGEEVRHLNVELQSLNASLEERVRERTASLEQRSTELARSNEELEQFAAVASHDLQEPLRTVNTCLQLIEENNRERLGPEDLEAFSQVQEASRRMHQLILDLLAFSRVGSKRPQAQILDAELILQEIKGQLKTVIVERHADLSWGPIPQVWAEPLLFKQLLQNLIGNAIKFCEDEKPRVQVRCIERDKELEFAVEDNGIGIDPGHHEKIFKLFKRLNASNKYQGSGLGLSICKKIVELHGGRIWVDSALKRGSTFYFSLPKSEEEGS